MKRRKALKHLGLTVGAIATTPFVISLLQGCKNEPGVLNNWKPVFFTTEATLILEYIVDLIIPKTLSSPGAAELNIHVFLDSYWNEVFDTNDQKKLKDGFVLVINELKSEDKTISDINKNDCDILLSKYLRATSQEEKAFDTAKIQSILHALGTIRFWTTWAFKTSEEIGKNVLAYDPIPGVYIGCIPLDEATGGRSWSF